jgi:hypothetical protein
VPTRRRRTGSPRRSAPAPFPTPAGGDDPPSWRASARLLIDADTRADIVNAVESPRRSGSRRSCWPAQEAVLVAGYLKENGVRLILAPPYTVPEGEERSRRPVPHARLPSCNEKGIPFAIASFGPGGYDARQTRLHSGARPSPTACPTTWPCAASPSRRRDPGRGGQARQHREGEAGPTSCWPTATSWRSPPRVKRVFIAGKPATSRRASTRPGVYGARK